MNDQEQWSKVFQYLEGHSRQLGALDAKMDSLVGNGQKGRIKDIEEKISTLEGSSNRFKGALYIVVLGIPPLGVLLNWLARKLGF